MTIPTVTLNDGNRMPQLGLGVWQVSDAQVVPTVTAAFEAGYRHIDTAAGYDNEEGVGEAIRAVGVPRDELFVTTKLHNKDHAEPRAALETSLRKLGLDHVDLYLIHWPVPSTNRYVEVWHALEQAQADGLTRSIGVSNFTRRFMEDILEHGSIVPAVNQIEFHPTYQQRQLERMNADFGVVTEAYSPLGMGGAVSDPTVAEIAERLGKTPAQVVLRWHLQQGRVAIPKTVSPARMAENLDVGDIELSAADLATIDALHTGTLLGWDPETV